MNTRTSTTPGSYTTPWTLRVYDALPGTPLRTGVVFTFFLVAIYLIGRALTGGTANSPPADLRIAITQILITAYSASAYAGVLVTARRATEELAPVVRHLPQWPATLARVTRHPWWLLPLVGAANFLLVGVPATNATTPAPVNPWAWQTWNYDIAWHRATGLVFVWWIGCFCYVTVVESVRLSRLSEDIESLDLLDLGAYQPLVQQGLTNALLVIGVVSVLSLLAVDSRYWSMLVIFWSAFIAIAWLSLMLPLRSIRKKISAAKAQELDWCRQRLQRARDALKSGAVPPQPIAEIMAYRSLVENIRNWPFDNPTLVRFTLYLLIPLGSWLGGAFVERGLDLFLS
jgi:hypothetical protein